MTNRQAIQAMREFQSDPRVGWLDEPIGIEDRWFAAASVQSHSPKRWMDAYLAACAIQAGARLVTFDVGFKHFESDGLDLVLVTKKRR